MKTYLKARCRKTGKWFGLEVEKERGPAVITNFVDITEEMAAHLTPQYSVDENIETGKNLIACKYCRSRKFAGCSCNKRRKTCSPSDKYDFQCVYCDELEIDYTGAAEGAGDVYNHVNVSNLPKSAFDRHGNPQGDQFDLAKDGSMKGFRVVVINCCSQYLTIDFTKRCLEKKGFTMLYYTDKRLPGEQELRGLLSDKKTQLWLISGANRVALSDGLINAIVDAYEQGRGIYIWGDNDPWFSDANAILRRIYNTTMFGDTPGGKNISIQTRAGQPGIIANHAIGTGIINFYEGVTIATIDCKGNLRPLVYGSACNIVTAYDDSNKRRLLADGGFTRLYVDTDKAGTERYVVNAAVWLANLERIGFRSLPKF